MPNDNMLTDTKLIIVDNFDEYIEELEDCAKQAGIPDVFVCDNVSDLEKELRKTPMDILILLSVSEKGDLQNKKRIISFPIVIYLIGG